jgi:hypothetical protein
MKTPFDDEIRVVDLIAHGHPHPANSANERNCPPSTRIPSVTASGPKFAVSRHYKRLRSRHPDGVGHVW